MAVVLAPGAVIQERHWSLVGWWREGGSGAGVQVTLHPAAARLGQDSHTQPGGELLPYRGVPVRRGGQVDDNKTRQKQAFFTVLGNFLRNFY